MHLKTVLYVDPYSGGHRPDYLKFFRGVCSDVGLSFRAFVPEDVWIASAPEPATEGHLQEAVSLDGCGVREHLRFLGRLENMTRDDGKTMVFFSMVDKFVLPLAIRTLCARQFRLPWSGIYFRDSFSYLAEEVQHPFKLLKTVGRASALWVANWRSVLPLVVHNEDWKLPLSQGVVFLPDAMTEPDRLARNTSLTASEWPVAQLPQKDSDRTRFLIYGSLAPRKGIVEFCDGLLELDDELLRRVDLHVIGLFYGPREYRQQFLDKAEVLRKRGALVELTEDYASWTRLDAELRWCDVTVATYINHLGQSGVLGTSVQYGRPLITQANYHLGELTRKYELGCAVEPTNPKAVAAAIHQAITGRSRVGEKMRAYREHRSPERAQQAALAFFATLSGRHNVVWSDLLAAPRSLL